MANRRSSSPGGFRGVSSQAQVSPAISGVVADNGAAARAAASVFGGLGDQLGAMAARARRKDEALAEQAAAKAQREAEAATRRQEKAAGEQAGLAAGSAAGSAYLPAGQAAGQPAAGKPAGQAATVPAGQSTATSGAPSAGAVAEHSRLNGTSADLDKLSGSARGMLDGITRAGVVPEIRVKSGFRDAGRNAAAGGAKKSQHMHGNALDIDISGYSDEQKAALLQSAIANGARGIGIYKSGNSLHIDTRENPALWGALDNAYAGHGVDQAPKWAQPALQGMFSGKVPAAPAIALRNDGTPAGEAYDAAAERSFSWRYAAGVDTQLSAAFERNQDNPEGFAAEIASMQQQLQQDPNLADPQLREIAQRQLTERSRTYLQQATRGATARQRADNSAAADEQYQAARSDIERRGFAVSSSPEGDADLQREIRRNHGIIDSQLRSGAITAHEAAKRKRELTTSAATSRVRGTFEQLPDTAAKEAFAKGLTAAWSAKDGPIGDLDYSAVYALQNELTGKARAERNVAKQSSIQGRVQLTRALRADIASLGETGAPALVGGQELAFDDVAAVVGAQQATKWQDDRQAAKTLYDATSDFPLMSEAEINGRLEELQPVAGEVQYEVDAKVRDQATAKAKKLVELRRTDPATAVDQAFDAVRAAKDALDPNNPASYRELAGARLDAQSELGIPELARLPLTKREAQAIALEITRAPNPDRAALDVGRQIAERYGEHADEVLSQVLRSAGAEKEAATMTAGILRRAGVGQPVRVAPRADTRAADDDMASASAAVAGQKSDRPSAFKQVPTFQSIRQLLENPTQAKAFDARFGAGWADFYLRQGQAAPAAASDDGESWSPDQ